MFLLPLLLSALAAQTQSPPDSAHPTQDDFWAGAWARLEAADETVLAALGLEIKARRGFEGTLEAFRARVLTAYTSGPAQASGGALLAPERRVSTDGAPAAFAPGEAWPTARAVVPGAVRARAFADVLAGAEGLADDARLVRRRAAFAAFLEDEAAFRPEPATVIARAMNAEAQATWSAYCVEGIARRSGRYDEADAVLAARLGAVSDPRESLDVLQRRAISAAGAGLDERALDYLGSALARGGTDATQILARGALASGQRDRARRLFRTLLGPGPTGTAPAAPWALRGWGMAQLPAADHR
ncbi:MAG: hypothetical protein GY711_09610 [bacterium]|nr:hypothetical protein [bacterium]